MSATDGRGVPSVGIDLGATHACVATWRHGAVEVIPNDIGERITPSCVAFTESGRLIGSAAKSQSHRNAGNSVFDAMRLIGRKFDDPTVQSDIADWPFQVVRDSTGRPTINVSDKGKEKRFYAADIAAMLLTYLREMSEAHLGTKVSNAVLTVPAYFNRLQRRTLQNAGQTAGLNVLRVINASTAAAIAYGLETTADRDSERNVVIFDLGGATCDVSLLSVDEGVFEVLAVAGNTQLGGSDFDTAIFDHFAKQFEAEHSVNLRDSKRAMSRLRTACECAKKTLSVATRADIEIDSLYQSFYFDSSLTRVQFEDLCATLFAQCLEPLHKVWKDSRLSKSDIHDVVLVGGSTRIPRIEQMVREFFDGSELRKSLNPDESIAVGAAIQAGILSGDEGLDEVLLLDVTPLSLGIATHDAMTAMIHHNSFIPCTVKKRFATHCDDQSAVMIEVFEGGSEVKAENNFLGCVKLAGVAPTSAGATHIDVAFDIDANSILTVSATDTKDASVTY